MMVRQLAVMGWLLSLVTPVRAHRLDEYLQATIVSVDRSGAQAFLRLVPGVAVAKEVLSRIDTDGDGNLSEAEQRDYARRVLNGFAIRIDGHRVEPVLVSSVYSSVADLMAGTGEIQIDYRLTYAERMNAERRLTIESHQRDQGAAYLMNCLVPADQGIAITRQTRNEQQSAYEVVYRVTNKY